MRVSDVPFDLLCVGKRVKSLASGWTGVISALHPITEDYRGEDNMVSFAWDNGKKSEQVWHFWCDKVELADEEESV